MKLKLIRKNDSYEKKYEQKSNKTHKNWNQNNELWIL